MLTSWQKCAKKCENKATKHFLSLSYRLIVPQWCESGILDWVADCNEWHCQIRGPTQGLALDQPLQDLKTENCNRYFEDTPVTAQEPRNVQWCPIKASIFDNIMEKTRHFIILSEIFRRQKSANSANPTSLTPWAKSQKRPHIWPAPWALPAPLHPSTRYTHTADRSTSPSRSCIVRSWTHQTPWKPMKWMRNEKESWKEIDAVTWSKKTGWSEMRCWQTALFQKRGVKNWKDFIEMHVQAKQEPAG